MSEQKKHKSAFKGEGMFRSASHLVFELAKDLRRNMTDAEKLFVESFKSWSTWSKSEKTTSNRNLYC